MSCPQCFTGHINPGTSTGRWDTVYGRRTYVAELAPGKQALGVIVIIPDAFRVDFVNNQILADHYASAAQFLVYLHDFMDSKLRDSPRSSHQAPRFHPAAYFTTLS
jgi:hypothetical protein